MRCLELLLSALACVAALSITASTAAAHCCHDDRDLGAYQQSGLRRGVHGAEDGGLTDESIHEDAGSDRLGRRTGSLRDGGVGQMRGNGIGSYGAGSIGERAPGGLGSMRNGGMGNQPPRTR